MNSSAHVYGPIYDKWLEVRGHGTVHAPRRNLECQPVFNLPYNEACRCIFDGAEGGPAYGFIQWNPETGAHYFGKAIIESYDSDTTGHSITDELPTSDGVATYMLFTNNNKPFETQKTNFTSPSSALSWTQAVHAPGSYLSGNVTLIVNGCSHTNVCMITDFSVHADSAFDYTVACALRDFDGRIYTVNRTSSFDVSRTGIDGQDFVDKQYCGFYGDNLVNFQAMAFTDKMEYRVAPNAVPADLVEDVVNVLRLNGPSLNMAFDLVAREPREDQDTFWKGRCNFPKEDLWLDRSTR